MAKQQREQKQTDQQEKRPDEGVPQPPPFERKLEIARLQLIGIPLLALLPILAIFGVFGESRASAAASNAEIEIVVDYPSRYRYHMTRSMSVVVTNLSQQSPTTITVALDRSYLDQFAQVSSIPSIQKIMADAYIVELSEVETGETHVVDVEMQAEGYWNHRGTISASVAGGEPVTVSVSTTIFP